MQRPTLRRLQSVSTSTVCATAPSPYHTHVHLVFDAGMKELQFDFNF